MLERQGMEAWRPPGRGPMRSLGCLRSDCYEQLVRAGWIWEHGEDEYDEIPGQIEVILLARGGHSRFMLEAATARTDLGVHLLGPNDEDPDQLRRELLGGLGIAESSMASTCEWPSVSFDEAEEPATWRPVMLDPPVRPGAELKLAAQLGSVVVSVYAWQSRLWVSAWCGTTPADGWTGAALAERGMSHTSGAIDDVAWLASATAEFPSSTAAGPHWTFVRADRVWLGIGPADELPERPLEWPRP